MDKLPEAIDNYEKAIALDPTLKKSYKMLVTLYKTTHNKKKAKQTQKLLDSLPK